MQTDTRTSLPADSQLDVLLFSPVAGRDPLSGDTSYTDALLSSPPPGVRYVTYPDAIRNGTVKVRGRRPGRGARLADSGALAARAIELAARRTGLAFREPTWFVEIDTSAYDLVHQHLFTLRPLGRRLPVVATSGYPLTELYRAREGWSEPHLRIAEVFERGWCTVTRTDNPHFRVSTAAAVLGGYSVPYVEWLRARNPAGTRTRVIGTGLPALSEPRIRVRSPGASTRLLFIGRDFRRKGGDLAVAAHERLRTRGLDVELTVVTAQESHPPDSPSGVTWLSDLTRDVVVDELLPSHDVLVLPTRADCGVPYAVLEAMRAGLAVVISDLRWLDERLETPGVSRTSLTAGAVGQAIERLLGREEDLVAAQRSALAQWDAGYTMVALGEDLRKAYDEAVAAQR